MGHSAAAEPSLDRVLEGCREGDRDAFRALYDLYGDRVYSFALHFLGDAAHAADLTQDIFVKLFAQIKNFRGDSKFETWLYRVVANAAVDRARRQRRYLPFLSEGHPAIVSGRAIPEEGAARSQAASAVRSAVAKLSSALRAPVVLRYVEGLSYEEIAEALQLSPGTVASRLNRAHKTLARKLERFGNNQ